MNYASGQQRSPDKGLNWVNTNYDKLSTSFSPQTTITKNTITRLQDAWASANPVPPIVPGIELDLGIRARPLSLGGVLYFQTNTLTTIAYKGDSGFITWGYSFPVNMTQVTLEVPEISPFNSGVVEGIGIFEDSVIVPTPDCGIVKLTTLGGIPAFIGELTKGQMCHNVQGNAGYYTGQMLYAPIVYEEGRILITGTGVSGRVESGRGFVAGYDADTGKQLWRFFLMPPAGGDPNWAAQFKGKGNVDPVAGDWGDVRGVGVGVGWGEWAIDGETGIVYVGTSAPAPYYNATRRPGPNLFSSSILALDAKTGELKWYYQTSSHDLSGFGCQGNTALGKIGDQKTLFKACDNGRVYALDAATGKLIWSFLPPSVKYLNAEDNFGKQPDYNKATAIPSNQPHWRCPGITGASGGDIAVAYGKVFYVTTNFCDYMRYTAVEPSMLNSTGATFPDKPFDMAKNTTIYALDASTGTAAWSYSIPDVSHRGGLIATGEMVMAASLDGNLYGLDVNDGTVVFEKYFASPLGTSPIISASALSEQFIFVNVGGVPTRFAETVSGLVFAYKLRPDTTAPTGGQTNPPESQLGQLGGISFDLLIPIVVGIVVVLFIATLLRRNKSKVKPNQTKS
ncbi:MAG: PQQ-binding-like beta-propeller repeat protein [Thaumarchaeota archaeon]|nr:PQQ-binding-like beta-propeller repeat protein [Nitrososphaerota archaeon]